MSNTLNAAPFSRYAAYRGSLPPTATMRRDGIDRALSTIPLADPHIALRPALLKAFVERQRVRPIFEIDEMLGTVEYRAAFAADRRLYELIDDVLDLPPPKTLEGLAVVGLAAALFVEGTGQDHTADRAREMVAVVKAIGSVVDIGLPAEFLGYGDEPDYDAREAAMNASAWALPA